MTGKPETGSFSGRRASHDNTVHVQEGKTHYISLHGADGNHDLLAVTQSLFSQLRDLSDVGSLVKQIDDVFRKALVRLERDFSDRVGEIAPAPMYHDGEIVWRVKPIGGVFDLQLSVDLNALAWDLEDELCESLGSDLPPVQFGFRQEFAGGDED